MKLWGLVIGASALVWLGCSKEGSSASPSAGPAGVVVELSGSVEATRSGETRALAVDAEVFADDTIKTGDDSSVAVKLTHNNAALRLEAGMQKRVDQSLAWKAPRREDDSVLDRDVDDQTAAAGRHTEREAAGTATTAVANTERAAESAPRSEAPAEIAPAPAKTAKQPAPRAERRAKKRSAPPPPPPQPKPMPRPNRDVSRKSPKTGGASPKADVSRAPAAESAPAPGGSRTRGGPVDVKKLMASRIKVCHALAEDAKAGSITAVVEVSADGSIKVLSIKGDSALAAVTACARSKIARLAVGGAKPGTYKVTVALK